MGRAIPATHAHFAHFPGESSNPRLVGGAVALRRSDEGNLLAQHATPKPVALVADAIMDVSARGDIVLDAFLSSGTSAIAVKERSSRNLARNISCAFCDRAGAFSGLDLIHCTCRVMLSSTSSGGRLASI